jgi:hypothetical protein
MSRSTCECHAVERQGERLFALEPNLAHWQVFSALDVDMTGRIGFAELYLFVMGRANHVTGSVSTGFNAKASRDEVR